MIHTRSHRVVLALVLVGSLWPAALAGAPASAPLPEGVELTSELVLDGGALHTDYESGAGFLLGKAALALDLDTARAGLWNGGRVRVSLIGTFGEDPSLRVGDVQVVSNIAAPEGVRFLEAWVEQSLGSRMSILAGYHDLNSEFDVIESAAELLNSSFGIGPEISQFGPSIFPSTHPGLRARVAASQNTYLQAAAYRDVPVGETDTGREWTGHLEVAEAGWTPGASKIALGAWKLSATEPDGKRRGPMGYYLLGETTLQLGERAVGLFARAGRMREQCHPVHGYVGAGVRVAAALASRPDDVVSFGVARADLVPKVQQNVGTDAETTVELSWLIQVNDWLAIQPDVQYVDAPAGTSGQALVGAVRIIAGW